MGNRIVANFKAKLGQLPSKPEEEMDAEGKQILVDLRKHFRKITDGVTVYPKRKDFKGDELISDFTEFVLISQYVALEDQEIRQFKSLGSILEDYPIYNEFLKDVKGIGPAMAGVIISEIDITKARYPSSLWMYAGLDVAGDGRGRSRRAEHLVKRQYKNAAGEDAERNSITFNPFLKTKLIGVLGSSFLRAGDNKYSQIYRDYKNRLQNRPDLSEESKARRHNMATRYMIKQFLCDLYNAWRPLEGLPVAPPYAEAKLGLKHGEDKAA
jgi:hypothetical protein